MSKEYIDDEAIKRIEKIAQQEAIDNSNPSEALKDLKELHELAYGNDKTSWKIDDIRMSLHIKQALIKAQEQEKVLKVIFEKKVNIYFISTISTYDEYLNSNAYFQPNIVDYRGDYHKEQLLTQEEFDLLKRYFK